MAMKLVDMPWNAWPGMDRLLHALGAANGDTRVVGGAVRDTLLALEWLVAAFGTHVVWRGARMTVVGGERAAAAVEAVDGR